MTALDGDHLDETVFGPPAHDAIPHGHSHDPGKDPAPGALHWHPHAHRGIAGGHNHRHGHAVPEGDT